MDRRAQVVVPKQFAAARLDAEHAAGVVAGERDARCGRQHAGRSGVGIFDLPFVLASRGINCAKSPESSLRTVRFLRGAAEEPLAALEIRTPAEIGRTRLTGVDEKQPESWVVRRWIEVRSARKIRTRHRSLFIGRVVRNQ